MKIKRKPIVLDGVQWNGDMSQLPAGCEILDAAVIVKTLEGNMIVSPGDWIITGVKGERWPVKPDIFNMTYEKLP